MITQEMPRRTKLAGMGWSLVPDRRENERESGRTGRSELSTISDRSTPPAITTFAIPCNSGQRRHSSIRRGRRHTGSKPDRSVGLTVTGIGVSGIAGSPSRGSCGKHVHRTMKRIISSNGSNDNGHAWHNGRGYDEQRCMRDIKQAGDGPTDLLPKRFERHVRHRDLAVPKRRRTDKNECLTSVSCSRARCFCLTCPRRATDGA